MTGRIPLDHLTSNQYDQLCDRLEHAETALTRVRELATRIRQGAPWTANHDNIADHIHAAIDQPTPNQPATWLHAGTRDHNIPESEPTDPAQCTGEEGFCPDHGFHRHSLKQPSEPEDTCRPVNIDGETIRVRGSGELSEESRAALVEIIRAAKRRMEAEQPSESWRTLRAVAFNAVGPALKERDEWLRLTTRRTIADAVLTALAEHLEPAEPSTPFVDRPFRTHRQPKEQP